MGSQVLRHYHIEKKRCGVAIRHEVACSNDEAEASFRCRGKGKLRMVRQRRDTRRSKLILNATSTYEQKRSFLPRGPRLEDDNYEGFYSPDKRCGRRAMVCKVGVGRRESST